MEERTGQAKDMTEYVAMKVSKTSIFVNLILSILKLAAGLAASSGAMVSDAVHSASDVFSTCIVMIGIKMSSKEADKEHPYGHERMECVAAIVLAVTLLFTGFGIGAGGVRKLTAGSYENLKIPGMLALIAAVVSIVIKEGMFWYTVYYAKKINSSALMADAWHHRSDALSSVGSFIGIFAARLGYPAMDPAASLVICLFIMKAAYDIFKDAVDKMVDKACDAAFEEQLRETVLKQQGVIRIDRLNTRAFGNRIYVDVEIAADGRKSLYETHAVAESVHNRIEKEYTNVKHIMVHVNPADEKQKSGQK